MPHEEINKEVTERLKQIYAPYFDSEYLDQNLEVPRIYTDNVQKLDVGDLYSLSRALSNTISWTEMFDDEFLERRNTNQRTKNDTIFLVIGEWGSHHEFLLCCDKSSEDFAKIFDFNDAHPWCGHHNEVEWADFREFLKEDFKIDLE